MSFKTLSLLVAVAIFACSAPQQGKQAMTPEPTTSIDQRMDRDAIARTFERFADAAGRKKWESMVQLFIPDAVWEADAGPLGFRHEGREAMRRWLLGNVGTIDVLFYLSSTPTIDFIAPGRVRARVSMAEVLHLRTSGETVILFGAYSDELVKMGDEWLFAHRRFSIAHQMPSPNNANAPHGPK